MTAELITVGATACGVLLVEKLPALADKWAKDRAGKRADAESKRQHAERMAVTGGAE